MFKTLLYTCFTQLYMILNTCLYVLFIFFATNPLRQTTALPCTGDEFSYECFAAVSLLFRCCLAVVSLLIRC